MNTERFDYGDWATTAFFALFFLLFALTFARPTTVRDWRSFGAFSAFFVALFVEMYGFPLTIYFLAGWLQSRFPGIEVFSHETGHLWHTILGLKGEVHSHPLDIFSSILIVGGLIVLVAAWRVLYRAQKEGAVARKGIYSLVRHPQYGAFILMRFGYLITWPTIPTLIMFPVLVFMYLRLARKEEREALAQHGERYESYVAATPTFVPGIGPLVRRLRRRE